ncbi:YkgJ family cysteine cluster protein [Candidatus Woesearchaeota archaeon]|nr:YkgJ family cysteine cluster protein [Candidatus Woesearchaeota archaeon]
MKSIALIRKETPVSEVLKLTQPCGCAACRQQCKYGSGFASDDDLPKIAKHLCMDQEVMKQQLFEKRTLLNTALHRPKTKTPQKPFGECVFFDYKRGCTIHEVKPLQCKLAMGCKEYGNDTRVWFLVNYFLNPADPQSIREYATYLKTGGHVLGGATIENICPNKALREQILSYERLK